MSTKMTICFFIIAGLSSSCDRNSTPALQTQTKTILPIAYASKHEKNKNDLLSVASVGGSSISVDVLRYYLAQKGFGTRDKKINKEILNSVLNELISLELYKQAAIKEQLDQDPAMVLATTRILSNKYQTDILAINSKHTQVSNEEIKARFEKNKKQYMTPARRRGAIISVRLKAKPDTKEHKEARQILEDARESADSLSKQQKLFGNLVDRYSDDVVSKKRQGDIGWIVEGGRINRYEPVVIETLFSLSKVGDISSVVKGERGYYLVKLVDLMPEKQQTLKQVERTIYMSILEEKRHAAELDIRKELNKQFKVSINDSVMDDFIAQINTRNIDKNNMPPTFPVSVETN